MDRVVRRPRGRARGARLLHAARRRRLHPCADREERPRGPRPRVQHRRPLQGRLLHRIRARPRGVGFAPADGVGDPHAGRRVHRRHGRRARVSRRDRRGGPAPAARGRDRPHPLCRRRRLRGDGDAARVRAHRLGRDRLAPREARALHPHHRARGGGALRGARPPRPLPRAIPPGFAAQGAPPRRGGAARRALRLRAVAVRLHRAARRPREIPRLQHAALALGDVRPLAQVGMAGPLGGNRAPRRDRLGDLADGRAPPHGARRRLPPVRRGGLRRMDALPQPDLPLVLLHARGAARDLGALGRCRPARGLVGPAHGHAPRLRRAGGLLRLRAGCDAGLGVGRLGHRARAALCADRRRAGGPLPALHPRELRDRRRGLHVPGHRLRRVRHRRSRGDAVPSAAHPLRAQAVRHRRHPRALHRAAPSRFHRDDAALRARAARLAHRRALLPLRMPLRRCRPSGLVLERGGSRPGARAAAAARGHARGDALRTARGGVL